jgi:N-acetylneuraminate synthase
MTTKMTSGKKTSKASKGVYIAGTPIGGKHPAFIIAELGINHNGDVAIAKRLIDAAIEAGANAIKFQKRTVSIVYTQEELSRAREVPPQIIANAISRKVLSRDAVKRLAASNLTQATNGDLKWALEFTFDEYKEIDRYCKEKGIMWFGTPWDEESVDFLEKFNPPCYKIASASLTDASLLRFVRSKGKPVILSTGMSTMEQIQKAVKILGEKDLILMHCVSTYPAELRDINLEVIPTLEKKFPNATIGYSGHERGVEISVAARVMGASVVERHLTIDRAMWGSDQAASLEPKGMGLMVRDIRAFEEARGNGVKAVLPAEEAIIAKLRRKRDF